MNNAGNHQRSTINSLSNLQISMSAMLMEPAARTATIRMVLTTVPVWRATNSRRTAEAARLWVTRNENRCFKCKIFQGSDTEYHIDISYVIMVAFYRK